MRPVIKKFIVATALICRCAAFDPSTVTGLTPEQSAAVQSAEASLLSSLTAQPEFTSIVLELVTNSQGFAALTSFLGQPLQPGTMGAAELNSLFNQMPPDAQSFFRSVTAEEALIVSSIVNAGSTLTQTMLAVTTPTIPITSPTSSGLVQPPETGSALATSEATSVISEPTLAGSTATATTAATSSNGLTRSSQTSLASAGSESTSGSAFTSPSSAIQTTQAAVSGSTLATINANATSLTSTPVPTLSGNTSARVRGGGLGLVLAILVAVITIF